MNIKAKLLNYIEKKNISKSEFYLKTGLSNGFLDKKGSVTSSNLEKILANYEDLNIEWLLLGNGEMLRNSLPSQKNDTKTIENLNYIIDRLREENEQLKRACQGLPDVSAVVSSLQVMAG